MSFDTEACGARIRELREIEGYTVEEMAAKTFHSTTFQAARTALDAGVKRLLVGHYSSRYPDVSFFLDELRSIFPATDLAHDLDVIEIER